MFNAFNLFTCNSCHTYNTSSLASVSPWTPNSPMQGRISFTIKRGKVGWYGSAIIICQTIQKVMYNVWKQWGQIILFKWILSNVKQPKVLIWFITFKPKTWFVILMTRWRDPFSFTWNMKQTTVSAENYVWNSCYFFTKVNILLFKFCQSEIIIG